MLRRTIAMLSLLAMPALAAAQGGNGNGNGNGQQGNMGSMQDTTGRRGAMGGQHAMSRRSRSSQLGMTHDQVRQLQQALIDDGCLEGQADGVVGPKTRRAIACARQKANVTGNDPNDLLRSLNLGFTVSSTTGWSSVMKGPGKRGDDDMKQGRKDRDDDARGRMRDSSGTGRGKTGGRPRPGNMRDSSRRDSTRTPPR